VKKKQEHFCGGWREGSGQGFCGGCGGSSLLSGCLLSRAATNWRAQTGLVEGRSRSNLRPPSEPRSEHQRVSNGLCPSQRPVHRPSTDRPSDLAPTRSESDHDDTATPFSPTVTVHLTPVCPLLTRQPHPSMAANSAAALCALPSLLFAVGRCSSPNAPSAHCQGWRRETCSAPRPTSSRPAVCGLRFDRRGLSWGKQLSRLAFHCCSSRTFARRRASTARTVIKIMMRGTS